MKPCQHDKVVFPGMSCIALFTCYRIIYICTCMKKISSYFNHTNKHVCKVAEDMFISSLISLKQILEDFIIVPLWFQDY